LPRVQISLNLREPVRFRARVEVELVVAELGRTSVTFSFTITAHESVLVDGRVVAVHVGADRRPTEWTARQRTLLLASGEIDASAS
jgi:acyl-CoA thioesterase FadM